MFGKTEAEHDEHMDIVTKRTQEVGLNPDKCDVHSHRIKFFRNYLSSKGLEPDPDKIAAIVDMTPPTNAQELQSFLGMVNYLSRYTPDLATTTAPLRDLTKKDIIFVWGPEHQKAFDNVTKSHHCSINTGLLRHEQASNHSDRCEQTRSWSNNSTTRATSCLCEQESDRN